MKKLIMSSQKSHIIFFILNLLCFNVLNAQTSISTSSGPSTVFYQFTTNPVSNSKISLGFQSFTPTAKFHIIGNPSTEAVLEVVGQNSFMSAPIVTVENCILRNSNYYGIYQTHQQELGISNYFQDPVKIGRLTITNDGPNGSPSIYTDQYVNYINFVMSPNSGVVKYPLTINGGGIRVQGKSITDEFQLITTPGLGKVLVSDIDGNGTWTDVSGLIPDYWQLINNNVCLNTKYNNVGIGTDRPAQKLHVLDGNILISRSPIQTKAPGSKNGSVLFGDFITEKSTLGEWGIEYYTGNDDYASNGLNFWKPFSSGNGGGNDYLYIRNDGNIGIGTEQTHGYRLAVKGRILCEELKVQLYDEWGDYVFDKSYKLMPLYDVERFINANHHLPDVPSADEVKTNGLNVGEMNTVLMKKVEELTLYMINQQKQIINQQKQIAELKSAIQNK